MKFDGKTVKTVAVLYAPAEGNARVDGDSDAYFYSKKCNNKDYFALADFSKAANLNLYRKAYAKLVNKNSPQLYLITFTGKLSLSYTSSFGHLGWLRAQFIIKNIDSVKPLYLKYRLPDHDADAPVLSTGNSLRMTNDNFMFALLAVRNESYKVNYLLTDNTQIRIDGKLLDNNELTQISNSEKQGEFRIRVSKITVDRNQWIIRGTITNKVEEKTVKRLNYDNKFLLQKDNSWKLISSTITEMPFYEN
jgi:hypothetical protein